MKDSQNDQSIQPPLTLTTCPVTYSASSEAKKATVAATSSTVGGRPIGKRASRMRRASSSVNSFSSRSEEHTSELQSQSNLVCRLLLEKKKKPQRPGLAATTHSESTAT